MPKITFKGKVFSGNGEGKKFVDLPWVNNLIQQKLGFTPYPGTLNIRLTPPTAKHKKQLEKAKRLEICPQKGYCTGILIKARINDIDCAIIMPKIPSYPADVLELIAPWYLRERLKLIDGDQLAITVTV